jgi:hypothetical protein
MGEVADVAMQPFTDLEVWQGAQCARATPDHDGWCVRDSAATTPPVSKKPSADPARALAESVRARLAAGRSMAALKEAKDLAKRYPGAVADALLADAYQARIQDLAKQGLHAEARELLQVASARFPQAAATWQRAAVQAARVAGDLDDLLHQWRTAGDDAARERVGNELRAAVRDPGAIAASSLLAADDPLRVAAGAVQAAFTEAAAGELSDATRDRLRVVSRRSPLSPWRQFALALDAFHRHDDAVAKNLLAQIPDDAGVARGKQVLLDLMHVRPLQLDTPASRQVARRVSDGFCELYAPLQSLLASDTKVRVEVAAARTLLVALAARRPRLAARLLRYLDAAEADHPLIDDLYHGLGDKIFGAREWARLSADEVGRHDRVAGALDWLSFVMPNPRGNELAPLSDLELAEVLQHMMPLLLACAQEVGMFLGPEFLLGMSDMKLLRELMDPLFDAPMPRRVEYALVSAQMTANLLPRLRRRTGLRPRTASIVEFLEHAVALDPTAERFAALVEAVAGDDKTSDAFLRQWAAKLPHDGEPLVRLAEAAEQRGAFAEALALLTRAAATHAVDDRVRAARLRLHLSRFRQHHKQGKVHLCAKDMAEIEADPAAQTPLHRAYLAAAKRVLGLATDAEVGAAIGDAERAALAVALVQADLDAGAPPVAPTPASHMRVHLENIAWLARIAEAMHVDDKRLAPIAGKVSREDIPAADADRLAICRMAALHAQWPIVSLASGAGLLQDGPWLARFLLYQARAALAERLPARAHEMFQLARCYAVRAGDHATARAARDGTDDDGHRDLDPARAAKLLADERVRQRGGRVLAAPPPAPPRARRPRQRKREGPVLPFDDAQAPVEPAP